MYILTDGERLQAGVQKLARELDERLASARAKLEGNLDFDQTNRLRGRVLEIKALLAMIRDDQPPPVE